MSDKGGATVRRTLLLAVPAVSVVLVLLAVFARPPSAPAPGAGPADLTSLPSQADNVVAVAVQFGSRTGDGLDEDNLLVVAEVDAFFRAMEGLRGYSSPLRATVVRASEFDIVVRPFVPAALLESYDAGVAAKLRESYDRFPEIHPYWSADFRTAAFYLELGSKLAPAVLVERLERLQGILAAQYGVALHFTGVRPIVELTGRLMVRDLRALLPLVGIATAVILLLTFGGTRGVLVALVATASAAAAGSALFVLLAGAGTPLLILAPVFAGGLFSDYAIHMGYHLGWRGDRSGRAARAYLYLPLALTAATTVIGFLALGGLGSTVHRFVAVTVSVGALAALVLALWWMPLAGRVRGARRGTAAGAFARRVHRLLVSALLLLGRQRAVATVVVLLPVAAALPQLGRLAPEPYPLRQLPAASTIVQAERIFNREFAGTVPFAVELDAGLQDAFLQRTALEHLGSAHRRLDELPAVGHQHSLLSVVRRIHHYFGTGAAGPDELPAADDPELFARVIAQYLLFYSASASPTEYEALTDHRLATVRLHGILRYRDFATLGALQQAVDGIREQVPEGWRVSLAGPAQELLAHGERLRRNWLSALAASAVLIFATVLAVFRNLRMALLSLVPASAVLVAVAGLAPAFGVRIDDYTVIALAITLGLAVDYTIHTLNALRHTVVAAGTPPRRVAERSMVGQASAIVRGCGVPMFMSFLTSVTAFLSLAVSSFSGAVHFGIMIAAAILGALVLSLLIAGWHLARREVACSS